MCCYPGNDSSAKTYYLVRIPALSSFVMVSTVTSSSSVSESIVEEGSKNMLEEEINHCHKRVSWK